MAIKPGGEGLKALVAGLLRKDFFFAASLRHEGIFCLKYRNKIYVAEILTHMCLGCSR